jgi:cyclopropane-fatty-acyl-phospholipid synthase
MMFLNSAMLRRAVASRAESIIRGLLEQAGITVGGDAPWDVAVHDDRFYTRTLRDGSLGFGEAYMEGWWDAPALDQTISRILGSGADERLPVWADSLLSLRARVQNLQSRARAPQVGKQHYDVGNDLYAAMLDRRMAYTCAYWPPGQEEIDLDAAQEAKLELVCKKIQLRPGMKILDLGCGWACFARYAAEKHGAEVTGYTISQRQVDLGRELCAGLPVELHLDDYRNARGRYDAVISIGIMEHVGPRNYRTYMEVVDRCLAPGGIGFIHTIAGNHSNDHIEPWMHRYIFPNAVLPSMAQMARAMEERFVLEDVHNIGPHYDRTLMSWWQRFDAAWPDLRERYGDRFYRMWRYYLLSCAATFRTRTTQLFQLVFTRPPTPQPPSRVC